MIKIKYLLVLLVSVAFAACSPAGKNDKKGKGENDKPNFILIMADDLRPDNMYHRPYGFLRFNSEL
ncbi:MAG: hypothetical protein ABFS16_13190 [Bacteroidota bacterium]